MLSPLLQHALIVQKGIDVPPLALYFVQRGRIQGLEMENASPVNQGLTLRVVPWSALHARREVRAHPQKKPFVWPGHIRQRNQRHALLAVMAHSLTLAVASARFAL